MASNIQNQGQQQGQTPGQQPGQSTGTPKSQQGTGYLNLQTLMGANQGNQLGQAVAGGIENTGKQATNSLQQGQQDFNTNSQANALGTQSQQQYVQNTLNNLGIGANGQPNSNASNITAPSSTDVSNFRQYMQGQYTGPTGISDISNIQNKAQNAQQQGQDISSSGGRQALLQQYAANPGTSYNQGDQALDTTLLGATGGNKLNQARQAVSGLTNQVNTAESAAQQQAAQLQNQAQGFGQAVTGQVTGAQQNVYNPATQLAQQDVAAANALENSYNTQNQAATNSNQLSQAALQALGLNAGQSTFGAGNLGQYIGYTPQNEQATALNVMSQPQYQQYSGLSQLLGQTPEAQGNAYQQGQITYNKTGAQNAINAAESPYLQNISQAQNIQNLISQVSPSGANANPQSAAAWNALVNMNLPGMDLSNLPNLKSWGQRYLDRKQYEYNQAAGQNQIGTLPGS